MRGATPVPGAQSPILERSVELQVLERLLDAAATEERGAVVAIEGAPGAGKTVLARRAAVLAAGRSMRVLVATGSELETGFPFGVARQLLEEFSDDEHAGELTGAAAVAASLLARDAPIRAHAPEASAVHGMYRIVAGLAERTPLLLVVDDAHWADVASLTFVHYLARRVVDIPVALLLSTRPLDAEHSPPPLASLLLEPELTLLRPAPLSELALAELALAHMHAEPAPEFVQACATATDGNPLLATELLRELARREMTPSREAAAAVQELAPDGVRRRVIGWLAQLPAPAGAIARSLAVLGQAELGLLARHAGVEVQEAQRACVELERAGLLEESLVLRFVHPLVAQATASTMTSGERAEAHLRAAQLLEESGAGIETCAVHLLAVRPAGSEWVAEMLHRAGTLALAQGAPAEARGFLERALAEPPAAERSPQLLLELGTAELRLRRRAEAAVILQRGLDSRPAPEVRTEVAQRLSQAQFLLGDTPAALAALEEAREVEDDERRLLSLDGNALSLGMLSPDRSEEMRVRLAGHRARAEAGDLDEPILLAIAGAEAVLRGEQRDRPVALMRRALELGLTPFDQHMFAFGWLVCALDAADYTEEALAAIDAALKRSQPMGDAAITGVILAYRTALAWRVGRLAEAEANGRAVLDMVERVAYDISFPVALLDVLLDRGHPEEARRLCEQQNFNGSEQRSAMIELVSARVAMAVGPREEALPRMLAAGEQLDALQFMHPVFAPWRVLAAPLAAALGDRELALRLAGELRAIAAGTQTPSAIALALRVEGEVREDLELLEQSVRVASGTTDVLARAHSLFSLGTLQRRDGLAAQARETLREAMAVAHEAGGLALAEQARRELVAAGGRPRRAALRGVEALTPAELEVARLAMDGMSNRDISDVLFVALKTVEQHLARTYAKLGISGRRELAAALGR